MRRETVYTVFAPGDAPGGTRVTVTPRAEAPPPAEGVTVLAPEGDAPARFLTPAGTLTFSAAGVLALARARGVTAGNRVTVQTPAGACTVTADEEDGLTLTAPRVELLNYAQPAFAARAITLDPLALDTRAMPAAVDAGLPFVVVPVQSRADLARATFALWRLRDLLPRLGVHAAVAFAEDGEDYRARAFAEAFGLAEEAAAGDAAGALAAWLLDNAAPDAGPVDAVVRNGRADGAPFEVRVHAERVAGALRVRVRGRVTRA